MRAKREGKQECWRAGGVWSRGRDAAGSVNVYTFLHDTMKYTEKGRQKDRSACTIFTFCARERSSPGPATNATLMSVVGPRELISRPPLAGVTSRRD